MIKLIENYFKINKLHNIYTIIILCIMFMIFRGYVDDVIQNKRKMDYANFFEDNMYIFNIQGKNIEQVNNQFNNKLGYVYMDILDNKEMQEAFPCYYVSEFYSEKAIKIEKGRKLSYDNNENEVLIFGPRLQMKYNIGDKVILEGTKYTVVGYIGRYDYILNLFDISLNENINIEDVSTRAINDDMFITKTNDYISSLPHCTYAITDIKPDQYTNSINFKLIKSNTYSQIGKDKRFKIIGAIMLFSLIVYIIIALIVIHEKRCGKLLAIYYICGISKRCYVLLNVLTTIAVLVAANIIYILLYLTDFCKNIFFQSNTMGLWCIYSSLLLSGSLIMGVIICNLIIIKSLPLEVVRKYE